MSSKYPKAYGWAMVFRDQEGKSTLSSIKTFATPTSYETALTYFTPYIQKNVISVQMFDADWDSMANRRF